GNHASGDEYVPSHGRSPYVRFRFDGPQTGPPTKEEGDVAIPSPEFSRRPGQLPGADGAGAAGGTLSPASPAGAAGADGAGAAGTGRSPLVCDCIWLRASSTVPPPGPLPPAPTPSAMPSRIDWLGRSISARSVSPIAVAMN